ncbi:Warthog protein [Seminavis robusta]|uniref:Warthog protein n=1 Tax=Seminavis robusta TaxID=568900 RepID=A0A9N8ERW6_9STRA|nr:Warthog protein [Seminavis robusta]|eukprot:Sro1781_g297080.1 Warthog protein (1211) ;mRNA; f:639-4366
MMFTYPRNGALRSSWTSTVAVCSGLLFLLTTPIAVHAQVVVENVVTSAESATIVIGGDRGWTEGVCYQPVQGGTGVFPGDRLEFRFAAHNVYQMASLQDFMDCNFTDATLLAQVGEAPFTYTIPDESDDVLYFACQVGDHCSSGTQKVQVPVTSFWTGGGGERLPPVSSVLFGASADDCNALQSGVVDESTQLEANRLQAQCSDPEPVEGESHTFTRSCLSGPATLTPGGVINRLFLMYYPFPRDTRVALGQRNFEFVTGSFEEGIVPVPVNQLYVHHLSGNIVFGQGAEGLRQDAPDAPFKEPYAIMSGDEGDFTIMHLIDLREVDDWLSCIECRCPTSSDGSYLDELANTGNITGGVNCCTNCTDLEGPTVDYRMRYNVTYRELQAEDEPVTHVTYLTADISPAIGMFLEYDVPSYEYLPQEQQAPEDSRIQRLERIEPFNEMFKDSFFQGDYSGPEEVQLLRCVAHLHVAAIGQWLEDAETGELLCSGETIYGTNPETDEGFLTAVSVDDHDPPITFPADRVVRFVTDYNATNLHTGVMGYLFVFVATPNQVTSKDVNLTVDVCIQSTCDTSLLPDIDLEAFQTSLAFPVERQADPGCVDTIEESPSCTFGGLCDCESFVNAPESSGCNGFYASAFGDIEIRSVCANYCGCDVTTAAAMDSDIPPTISATEAPGQVFTSCKDTLADNPACIFGNLCECEEFVNLPESGGCGGVYSTEMGDIVVSDVCAAYCGDCAEVSLEELFQEAYQEVVTMSFHDKCLFSTKECQSLLSNMYSCAEEKPGIETLDPLIRNFVVTRGRSVALESAKLGHPTLHVDQEDQVVGMCPEVDPTVSPEPPTPSPTVADEPAVEAAEEVVPEEAPAATTSADCENTLSSNPACTFGGLCSCEELVNAPQVEGDGCDGVYKNSFGDIAILSVCAKYCGCPDKEPPAVAAPSGPSFCFSEDSTVEVLGKGTVSMKHLNVGDKVHGAHSTYEPVYGFAHYDRAGKTEFLKIHMKGNNWGPLEVTGDHLVYVNEKFLPAKSVQVGDSLQVEDGSAVVTKITRRWKTGLYAPLTPSGTLLVNGVKVSSYVTLTRDKDPQQLQLNLLAQHEFIHMMLSPLRMACMGVAPSLCSNAHIDEQSGYHPFVGLGIRLANLVDHKLNIVLQAVLFCMAVCVVYPLYLVESIFGAALVPGVIAGLAVVVAAVKWWKPNTNVRVFWKNLKLKMA